MTRSEIEVILIARLGTIMGFVDMDNTTHDGTNVDLTDPIDWALRQTDGDDDCTLDLAELRLVKNILGNLIFVDITEGPRKESLDQLRKGLEAKKANLEGYIEDTYGVGAATLSTGLIALNFSQHGG